MGDNDKNAAKNQDTIYIGGNKESVLPLKEYTEMMYDNTIEEMKKRGASQKEIDIVENAKIRAVNAYDEPKTEDREKCKGTRRNLVGELDFEPLMSNLFIVKIGDVPFNMIRYLTINDNKKTVKLSVFETKDFSPYKYFSKNRKQDEITIEYLDVNGATIRTDKIYNAKVKSFINGTLSYENNCPIYGEITFKYKKYVPSAD